MTLVVPAVLAASMAFMLPVATPPNAVVFGSGEVTISQMLRGGIWLNVIAVFLIMLTMYAFAGWAFGISL
jgi:sodium-dependent dicarboxylate transporter 2/3/5